MPAGEVDAALVLDEVGHAPGGPEARLIPERFGPALEPLANAIEVRGAQPRGAAGAAGMLQRRASPGREVPCPAIHRLPMDADAPGHLRFPHPALEQGRRPESPSLEGPEIPWQASWKSHAGEDTTVDGSCHYIL